MGDEDNIKAQKGDMEAFVRIVVSSLPILCQIAASILKNELDQSDAVSNTITKGLQSVKKGKHVKNYLSWFRKVVRNECFKIHNKNRAQINLCKRINKMSPRLPDALSAFSIDLSSYTDCLNPLERQIIIESYSSDLTNQEIASKLNLPLGTVKSSKSRALAKMKLNTKKGGIRL
ncbi:RNA polymerase sigma factor [Paenibacillus sp. YN15]|uniref:RNA polymerase sigma factor n=1 Tax=Paenibacillus sp. YN15 TaxID=1742774 RepID=UPI000DCE925B|nr:sigma-70 family RNA polymerase sigma factor [Paenibacillus sp. YN15]RAV01184.1 hypothetical protein DQG13_12410 [Paenibacillus sp. YN15]